MRIYTALDLVFDEELVSRPLPNFQEMLRHSNSEAAEGVIFCECEDILVSSLLLWVQGHYGLG